MEDKVKCYNCRFFIRQDTGYSNYTVIETEIGCLKQVWEDMDESYSWRTTTKEHPFWKQAEECNHYIEGEGIWLDVDGEVDLYDYDIDLVKLAKEQGRF